MHFPVKLTFTSTIQQFEETLNIKRHYEGEYIIKNQSHYMRYHDQDSGLITLKYDFSTKILTILWQNHAIKKMIFDEKKATLTSYQLPQNQFHLTLTTKKINIITSNNTIKKMVLYYNLKQQEELFGQYKMVFNIEPY